MGALEGKTVVVTRSRSQAAGFVALLEERGARVEVIPTIELVPPRSWAAADRAIADLQRYDWLILTSVNGVRFFFLRLREKGGGPQSLAGLKVCAVGPRTRDAIVAEGGRVDFMPREHLAEAVVAEAGEEAWRGKRVLFARAAVGRDVIPDGLRRIGAEVDVVPVYRNIRPEVSGDRFRRLLAAGEIDAVTFTSSSTVDNFTLLFSEGEAAALLEGVAVACIGPVTAETAGRRGLKVDVMPEEYTTAALAEALEGLFAKGRTAGRAGGEGSS